jgi:hypothetical protein
MGLLDTGQYNRPGQPQRYGLLDPNVMGLIQSGGPRVAPAPAAPRRDRVSGWRVFDRVLGGQTVTEGLDAERERLQAEAMRPQMEARRARLRQAAEAMGPAAMLAFDLNPEKFGENLAEQYSPQVIAAGGIQSVIGNGQRVSAPQVTQFGDSLVRTDPLRPQPETLMQRGPTFQEQTARLTATSPVNVAPGNVLIDPQTGEQRGQGAPRILSAGEGVDLVSERGGVPIYQNAPPPRAPVAPTAANVELQGQLSALDTDVDPVLNEMVSMLDSGDVITGLGADQRLLAARAAAAVGNQDARRQVAATERYLNMAGRLRVGMAKSLGANPSNADLAVLQSVTAGDLGQSAGGLRATLQDGQALSQRQRAALRSRVAPAQSAPADMPTPGNRLSPQEAAALPPGTRFIGMDGIERVRQ